MERKCLRLKHIHRHSFVDNFAFFYSILVVDSLNLFIWFWFKNMAQMVINWAQTNLFGNEYEDNHRLPTREPAEIQNVYCRAVQPSVNVLVILVYGVCWKSSDQLRFPIGY